MVRTDVSLYFRLFLQDITANFEAPDSTLRTDAKLPIEPIEKAEPTEPIDMNEPYDPIDMNELRENALSTDCRELMERIESWATSLFMSLLSPTESAPTESVSPHFVRERWGE